ILCMLSPSLRVSFGCFQSKIWFGGRNVRQVPRLRLDGAHPYAGCFVDRPAMLPIELRIHRAQKLLRMIEQDAPLLAVRVAPLSVEVQRSAKSHAQHLAILTRAEIKRLLEEKEFAEAIEPYAAARATARTSS